MSEQRPMIENSDRGLTINKNLGWTMLVAIIGAVFWFGSTMSGLQASVHALNVAITAERTSVAALEARVRTLENQAGRFEEKLQNILTVLGRIDQKLEERQ